MATIRESIAGTDRKIVLAFFLTGLAAVLFMFLAVLLVYAPAGKIDAGTFGLLASMIMLFIKMAADACGYQTQSSAGSDKKDDTNATVAKSLADKVSTNSAVPSAVVVAWWGALDAAEQASLTAAAATDPKVQAFIDAAKTGKASAADLAYLVSKIPPLLSQARADALIQNQ
jgi:hypothetical protein